MIYAGGLHPSQRLVVSLTMVSQFVLSLRMRPAWDGVRQWGMQPHGLWSLEERKLHINILELLAIQFSLSALLYNVHDQHVRVESDNTTVIFYINSMGGYHSLECDTITKDIWAWALSKNMWLPAACIPGKTNRVADKMSREFNATLDWTLNSSFFDKVVQCFSRPTVDLFASRVNYRLPAYVS